MKDIFIDNNVASRFGNPADDEYKKLIAWLIDNSRGEDNAHLVVSNKLLGEYNRSNQNPSQMTAIPIIITKLQREGRLHHIVNQQIKDFKATYFTKKVEKRLTSNEEDREHIPVVLLSDRKMALSIDDAFIHDLINFPGFRAIASKRPEGLDYE